MLDELFERNQRHVEGLSQDHFDDVVDGQHPDVVAMTCADSRVLLEQMWSIEEPGWAFTPQTLGNQAWERVAGELVPHGTITYPVELLGTRTILVVGHTGCGAVQAALAAVQRDQWPQPAGVRASVELLVPVVKEALTELDPDDPWLTDRLVEANVDRQVAFLSTQGLPEGTEVHGFVYDLHGVYGGPRGRAYLINSGGEQDPKRLRARVDARWADHIARLG